MTISISKLECVDKSHVWVRNGCRVDLGSECVLFENDSDAEDAVIAMSAVDDTVEILQAAKRWCKATKALAAARQGAPNGGIDIGSNELDEAQAALIELIDKVRE